MTGGPIATHFSPPEREYQMTPRQHEASGMSSKEEQNLYSSIDDARQNGQYKNEPDDRHVPSVPPSEYSKGKTRPGSRSYTSSHHSRLRPVTRIMFATTGAVSARAMYLLDRSLWNERPVQDNGQITGEVSLSIKRVLGMKADVAGCYIEWSFPGNGTSDITCP